MRIMVRMFYFEVYFLIAEYFCAFSWTYSVWAHPVVELLPIPSSLQKKAAFVCLLDQTKLSITITKKKDVSKGGSH